MIFTSLKIQPLRKFMKLRKQKQQVLIQYNSLLSTMLSVGFVVYNGCVFRSIADFTIAFYKDQK